LQTIRSAHRKLGKRVASTATVSSARAAFNQPAGGRGGNSGNFANDWKKASEAVKMGGQHWRMPLSVRG
jgi:hypothetical protein